jgi:hypothetical protein
VPALVLGDRRMFVREPEREEDAHKEETYQLMRELEMKAKDAMFWKRIMLRKLHRN